MTVTLIGGPYDGQTRRVPDLRPIPVLRETGGYEGEYLPVGTRMIWHQHQELPET